MLERGGWILLVLMFGLTAYDLSRPALHYEERPAFSIAEVPSELILILGLGPELDGVHQFNDASQLLDVIKLAEVEVLGTLRDQLLANDVIQAGKSIQFQLVERNIVGVDFGWMPAAKRMALGIPLRVERMNASDWMALPGVGPSLALRINEYRQQNGEFKSMSEVGRVHGVGVKRLDRWVDFF